MKHILTKVAILLLISFNCYSQTKYEPGYFINNNGERVEGLIKNEGWKNNPAEFDFKNSENEQPKTETIESVKEFGINGKTKYLRATVDIDKSIERVNSLDRSRRPAFEEEQLFLEVLVEGKASLYSYEDGELKKYFFQTDNSEPEQLVFKSYLTNGNEVAENNYYKQQLLNNLKCSDLSNREIQKTRYKTDELVSLFIEYNQCENSDFRRYSVKKDRFTFKLNLKAGLQYSSLEIMNEISSLRDTDFESQPGFRVGLEAEFVLPFQNEKWSLLIEPTYQNFISEKKTTGLLSKVNYNSIEVPVGVRHYMFLDEDSKLFLNGLVIVDFDLNSSFDLKWQNVGTTLDIDSGVNFAVGFGYNYSNRYSAEVRYFTGRNLLTNYGAWVSEYNNLSLIFGYTLF